MKRAQRGFHCEDLYTREQETSRFKEVDDKIRSLHGTNGEHVWFRSRELPDRIYQCCIRASKARGGRLDAHIANDHLNLDLEQITLLTRCPIHYRDRAPCACLSSCAGETLKVMIQRRCQTLKHIMTNAKLEPSQEYVRLFEKLANTTAITSVSTNANVTN